MIAIRPARANGDIARQIADHRRVLDEIQRDPAINARTITVTLPDTVLVTTTHGLERTFTNYYLSAPAGAIAAGYIVETIVADKSVVKLTANGYGATITVRMTVW